MALIDVSNCCGVPARLECVEVYQVLEVGSNFWGRVVVRDGAWRVYGGTGVTDVGLSGVGTLTICQQGAVAEIRQDDMTCFALGFGLGVAVFGFRLSVRIVRRMMGVVVGGCGGCGGASEN